MRISQLSSRSALPIATIKFYIREGLLHAGTRTAANQADYDGAHLDRLDLIRALREVADLPVATIRETLLAIDRPATPHDDPDPLGIALHALSDPLDIDDDEQAEFAAAVSRVDDVLDRLGWDVAADAGARADLVRAVVAVDRHFPGGTSTDAMLDYGRCAQQLAATEIPDTWDPSGSPTDSLRYAVLGTVLFEPVILALRRLAHQDRHRRIAQSHVGSTARGETNST